MSRTGIEWTGETWNPTVGCDRISTGCAHCYAKAEHDRRHAAVNWIKRPAQYTKPFEALQLMPERLRIPLSRKAPTTWFVNSVSDLFHDDVPDDYVDQVFAVMALAGRHTFQILTKRADRMRDYMAGKAYARVRKLVDGDDGPNQAREAWWSTLNRHERHAQSSQWWTNLKPDGWPLPNVWLGVSVESQQFADRRIPALLETTAAIRFVSAEPLLGPVDLENVYMADRHYKKDALRRSDLEPPSVPDARLDWVIVGGESGDGARPFDVAWARSIVAQCGAAGIPVFVKQMGSRPEQWAAGSALTLKDRKGGDPMEWPEDLRVRQMPEARP